MSQAAATLFERDYFSRSLGPVVSQPEVALTELIANAWDAGATQVALSVPEQDGELRIEDDGTGMTSDEFMARWRTLRYNRQAHQGPTVEFPPGVERRPRTAYGRNGIGRHAMFCFANTYEVRTVKDGTESRFRVAETSGSSPFQIAEVETSNRKGHGTKLICRLTRNPPDVDEIRQVLAARFLYDPEFTITVNGQAIPLEDHAGLLTIKTYEFHSGIEAKLHVVDSGESARTKYQHGVAFWVSRRLVGRPTWTLDGRSLLDGRTKEAKRLTFIVDVDGLQDQVAADWTAFRDTEGTRALMAATASEVDGILREMMSSRIEEKVETIIEERKTEVEDLTPLAQLEVAEFTRDIAESQPLVADEVLIAAVDALIRLNNHRSGQELIQKLASFGPDDVEGLNRLLDQWTVRDALAVLDEVGRRIRVVEAMQKLAGDSSVDELHTLHPLVSQCRWVFGPEFDSPMFISNNTIRRAVERIVGSSVSPTGFENPRKRPDLIFLNDSTISATGVEGFDEGLTTVEQMLLLELKRGGSTIGRKDMNQAQEYVEELMTSRDIVGSPRIFAFVVGNDVDQAKAPTRTLKDTNGVERGFVQACNYNRLVDTAGHRLFRLRDHIEPMFPEGADSALIRGALAQQSLL